MRAIREGRGGGFGGMRLGGSWKRENGDGGMWFVV